MWYSVLMNLILMHKSTSDSGTFGQLYFGSEFVCFTGELPWRENQSNISCIPERIYTVKPHVSPRFGKCLSVGQTGSRTHVLIHAGNWCGDKSKGLKSDVKGCILTGSNIGNISSQKAVTGSKVALNKLLSLVTEPTKLFIPEVFGWGS